MKRNFVFLTFTCVLLLCAASFAGDTLTMTDGTQHTGTFVSATSTTITFREAGKLHRYSRKQVQSLELDTTATSPELSTRPHQAATLAKNFNLPAGTEIAVLT